MTALVATVCVIDGCQRVNWARGLCSAHYQQHRYRGTLDGFPLRERRRYEPVVPPHPNAEANPWAGQRSCPTCGGDDWAMPVAPGDLPEWRCVDCHLTFIPEEVDA